ncbi:hypothetical protein A8V01_08940 [Novosphingobium guangzhouense]|uniref:Uncharacterized protein n=2 Tax=Novosphingobium guangzhouense TaxID=1850347 RepID=A0A2K2FUR0_9SPHN|nr:hypothetical protein A8V01_08940 [Novosphingobium guangzhouense]
MLPDKAPLVEERNGMVAVWDGDEADPGGILMSAGAAIDTGFALLAEGARQSGGLIQPVRSTIGIEIAEEVDEDVAARLVLNLDGAPIAIEINATNVAEIAAALGAISREIG